MNRYIEFVKRKIKNKKDLLERLKNLKKYGLQTNELLTKNTEEEIEFLQQIKRELEEYQEIKSCDIYYKNLKKAMDLKFAVDYEKKYKRCHHCGQKIKWCEEDE